MLADIAKDVAKGVGARHNEFFSFGFGLMLMALVQQCPVRNSLGWAAYLMGVVLLAAVIGETVAAIRKKRSGEL